MPKRSGSAKEQKASKNCEKPAATPKPTTVSEPVMRRWPHPIQPSTPTLPPDPMLHYIRCALSYQNELLSEIKALLEEISARENL